MGGASKQLVVVARWIDTCIVYFDDFGVPHRMREIVDVVHQIRRIDGVKMDSRKGQPTCTYVHVPTLVEVSIHKYPSSFSDDDEMEKHWSRSMSLISGLTTLDIGGRKATSP